MLVFGVDKIANGRTVERIKNDVPAQNRAELLEANSATFLRVLELYIPPLKLGEMLLYLTVSAFIFNYFRIKPSMNVEIIKIPTKKYVTLFKPFSVDF